VFLYMEDFELLLITRYMLETKLNRHFCYIFTFSYSYQFQDGFRKHKNFMCHDAA
jgi:hypothetical protein